MGWNIYRPRRWLDSVDRRALSDRRPIEIDAGRANIIRLVTRLSKFVFLNRILDRICRGEFFEFFYVAFSKISPPFDLLCRLLKSSDFNIRRQCLPCGVTYKRSHTDSILWQLVGRVSAAKPASQACFQAGMPNRSPWFGGGLRLPPSLFELPRTSRLIRSMRSERGGRHRN